MRLMTKRLVIPRRVHLPFGYVVVIEQISDTRMDEMIESDAFGEPPDGYWDPNTRTIYIRRKLPARRKRYILGHELGHAWNDWQHHTMDNGIAAHF